MLTGRFGDTSGRPYIEARVIFPRLSIAGDISFLVDTGADTSTLMPIDGLRIGVPYSQLGGDSEVSGIGGPVHCFVERAVIVFTEPGVAAYGYDLELDIMQVDPMCADYPSLLGRDGLDNWRLMYDPKNHRPQSKLRAHVRRADVTIPLNSPA